jgi:hypothetical protein
MGSSVRDSLFLRRPRGGHSKPRPTPAAESLRVLGSRAAFIAERHFLKPRRRAQSLSQSRCAAQRRPPAAGRASTHSGPHPI